ncbi:hypothetical protein [Actinocatenispora comari]|uniref:Uncharacterized protein n=1 Tax=Actinocatenispora comari TaxID=2807577 RepID=A0A8J4AGY8_9ACTN|nr:hypothetical protein [Actinocatenispora comari]GIL29042.1 hypothetical protein NUM_42960 [Actinocatenispora comari]
MSKWEAAGAEIRLLPLSQQILDTFLARAQETVRQRYRELTAPASTVAGTGLVPGAWDTEAWVDDLDRALAALARQEFQAAAALLGRWPTCRLPAGADPTTLYLCGRGLSLLGDLRRDRGQLVGPASATVAYRQAREIAVALGAGRRVAQAELALAVITEMRGSLLDAARAYRRLADDDRLTRRDRARALLWVGTAIDKHGEHDLAARAITTATAEFEALEETGDWCVGRQKLALAARNAGRLDAALRHIGQAVEYGVDETPLQQVRLHTARGHILLTDAGTRNEGRRLLAAAEHTATQHGLAHQANAIRSICSRSKESRTA